MKQMKHMKRTELADQRTANRKVFENQDHSRTVEIYLEPVHYQDRGCLLYTSVSGQYRKIRTVRRHTEIRSRGYQGQDYPASGHSRIRFYKNHQEE